MTQFSPPVAGEALAASEGAASAYHLANELRLRVEYALVSELMPNPRGAKGHSKKQIAQIAASMRQFGCNDPLGVGPNGVVLVGNGRLQAAILLGLETVPIVRLDHLSPEQQRAYAIAHNRLAELSNWDFEILSEEMRELSKLNLDFALEITGFEGQPLEQLIGGESGKKADDKADRVSEITGRAITRPGDVWRCGKHRLICGDSTDPAPYAQVMGGELARMVCTDPPYNVAIDQNVGGKGKVARRQWAMACGEMSREEFTAFLTKVASQVVSVSMDGSIHYYFMDWRHLGEVEAMGRAAYTEMKNLIVWVKTNAGMGTFYRSQHEIVFVFKLGDQPHINNFGLGDTGRYRTNVWQYPGVNSFGAGRDEALEMHATVKPVAMIADAIRDVSKRGDIVLDPFGGSGTTMIAAQKTGRRARLIEIDPHYCDVISRRWEAFSGETAVLEATGQTFDQVAAQRSAEGSVDV